MTVDELLFGASPYLAVAIAIVGIVWRMRGDQFSISSLSSQFLESRRLFWGSVPWHYGIIVVLLGHLVAFLIPRSVLAWNGVPWRLYVLEGTALVFGLMTLVGLVLLILRRATDRRLQAVTSAMDVVLLLVLLVQVVAGVWTAIAFRWGSSWYAAAAVPYLRSLFVLQPDVSLVSNLPPVVKIHILGAFAFVALIPFTRLIHFLVLPVSYLWRPYQVVIWNRKKAGVE
jgi:nitrate reductase gamma subunit